MRRTFSTWVNQHLSRKWINTLLRISVGVLIFLAAWYSSFAIWVHFGYHKDASSISFREFMAQWGEVVALAATIVVGILVALIPSRLDAEVQQIAELVRQPLANFQAIYEKTLELLLWLKDDPGSVFIMTSATPVFGIELNSADRIRWTNALRRRIVTQHPMDQPRTALLCLSPDSPDSTEGLSASPLWAFCCELERSGLLEKADVNTAGQLYLRSITALSEFAAISQDQGFELKCGPPPPIHFVLARNADGESKAILYFTGIETAEEGLVVSGFRTSNDHWIRVINLVYDYVLKHSWDVLSAFRNDPRTPAQKERCLELLEYQLRKRKRYQVEINNYEIVVDPDVFPPEIGIGTFQLMEALRKTGDALKTKFQSRGCIGIDIGTGTGILALALSEYCTDVYATDISMTAVKNAEENFQRLSKNRNVVKPIRVYSGNLFEPLPALDQQALSVVVFNYPFYPSPLAVYNPAGRQTAGMTIIREFFDQLDSRLGNDTVIVMPRAKIAGENNPEPIAQEKGFMSLKIVEDAEGNSVYAFTRSEALADALGAQ